MEVEDGGLNLTNDQAQMLFALVDKIKDEVRSAKSSLRDAEAQLDALGGYCCSQMTKRDPMECLSCSHHIDYCECEE